jgi:carboxyl-terminal processing protease
LNDFNFSVKDISSFIKFANSKNIAFNEKDFNKDRNYIATRLKAEIARNYWKNEGWYSVLLTSDNQMLKAITLFDEAKNLANLK